MNRGIVGLLAANAISAIGSRMSMLAIPWLVLVTTGDPVKVGLVSGAEMLPYVLSGVLAAPLQDRFGERRTAIVTDLASVVTLGSIALAHRHFGLLLGLVAVAGMLRAVADRSKNNLFKPLMDQAKVDYTRVTSTYAGIMRTANLIGASVGGVAIAAFGSVGALWLDAASFGVCALLVIFSVPRLIQVAPPSTEAYFPALRKGFDEFRKDRLVKEMTWLLFFTNLFGHASTVIFVPLWVYTVLHSPVALGMVSLAFALGGILGNVLFTAAAPYTPRYPALVAGFLIGGAPTILILGLSDNLALVAVVTFVGGFAMCTVNPTIGAMIYQRVPAEMLARVGGIFAAVAFCGLPLGGLVGGWLVQRFGLNDGILIAAILLFAVTLLPVVRRHVWIEVNEATKTLPYGPNPFGLRVTLSYEEGQWWARARRGLRKVAPRQPVPAKSVLSGLSQLDVPAVHEAVAQVATRDQQRLRKSESQLRERIRTLESTAGDIVAALDRPR